ncbi:MAG: DUF6677 family protein [Phycisphaerae bacterium]|jgi:TM2 domain-containing membrane protein YozV
MTKKNAHFRLVALLAMALAWLIPGAGHLCVGRPVRAAIIFLTIGATFWAGMAMGGVMTVDSRNERWWYIAEMFTGVHGLAAWRLSEKVTSRLAAEANIPLSNPGGLDFGQQVIMDQKYDQAGLALVSPTDTIARAYAGVAGLMNLMCIFDALMLGMMGLRGEPRPAAAKETKP